MSKTIRILIADDHAIVRDGLAAIISFQRDLAVVGQAVNGRDAVEQTGSLNPDVVLLDLQMPLMNGVEAAAEIHRIRPDAKILILTTFGNSANLIRAFENGATGAITKSTQKEELFTAIRKVAAGERVISPEIQETLREDTSTIVLTLRQREILESLCRGLTNHDISEQFGISLAGVKVHLVTLFRKLGAANRAEAVAIALKKHLLNA